MNQKSPIFDFLIFILALKLITFGIGNYGLYEPHEGHFAMVAREMILRFDLITPHLNGAPYLNKPPLLYWLIATSIKIFGTTEFAVRLPISLAGWFGIVIAWLWTRELWGIQASRLTVLMLSVTTGWFLFSHQLLTDILLATLLLISNYFLWKLLSQPKSWFYFFSFYFTLGLCLLTKGLIGVIFPLTGLLGLGIITKNYNIWQQVKLGQGILIMIAVALPWFIAVEQANPGFLHYFIINEHFDRILDRRFPPDYTVSKISPLGYLGITAIWCLPWTLFFPAVIKFSWQQYQGKNRDSIILMLIAFALPIITFVPLSSRLIYYSIPAIPSYVMLCGGYFNYQLSVALKSKSDGLTKITGFMAILMGIFCLISIAFLPQIITLLPIMSNQIEINQIIITFLITLGLGFFIAGIAIVRHLNFLSLISLLLAWIITCIIVIKGFVLYQDLRSSKTLIETTSACVSVETLWVFEGSRELGAAGGIVFYLNQNKFHPHKIDLSLTKLRKPKQNNSYQTILLISDGGENRIPPHFPGDLPSYLISKSQLQTYWNSDFPVVFITDFLRQPNDSNDPPNLNLPDNAGEPLLKVGSRKLYGNLATNKNWCKQ